MVELSPQQQLDNRLGSLKEFAMDIYTIPPEEDLEIQENSDSRVRAVIGMISDQFVVQHELRNRGVSAKTRLLFYEYWSEPFWLQTQLISLGPL